MVVRKLQVNTSGQSGLQDGGRKLFLGIGWEC